MVEAASKPFFFFLKKRRRAANFIKRESCVDTDNTIWRIASRAPFPEHCKSRQECKCTLGLSLRWTYGVATYILQAHACNLIYIRVHLEFGNNSLDGVMRVEWPLVAREDKGTDSNNCMCESHLLPVVTRRFSFFFPYKTMFISEHACMHACVRITADILSPLRHRVRTTSNPYHTLPSPSMNMSRGGKISDRPPAHVPTP